MKKTVFLFLLCFVYYLSFSQQSDDRNPTLVSRDNHSEELDIGICLIENPKSDYCGFDLFKPGIWCKNYGTEIITSYSVSYRLDNYAAVSLNISQMLAPGDSTLVEFSDMLISTGNHSIQFNCSAPNNSNDSNTTNNNKSKLFNFGNGKQILITIFTDNFGSETSWNLTNSVNQIVAQGGGFESNMLYTQQLCLHAGCYTFTVYDSFGDGICMGAGDGYYLIENIDDNIEIATGCDFEHSEIATFCIDVSPGPPIAFFSHSEINNCTGSIEFYDLSSCNPVANSWLWNFGDGHTSDEQNPSHTFVSNGFYTVTLSVSNENGTSQITVPNSVYIEKEMPPLISEVHFCFGENVSLASSENEIFEWFSYQNDVTPEQIGSTFNFYSLENDTTIYYQFFIEPEYYNLGIVDSTSLGGYFGFSIDRAVYFDAISDLTITKATVYASGAATRTITLKNSVGTTLYTRIINIPDGESVIDLNFEIVAGNDYAIHVNTANNLSYTGDYDGPNVGYPFTIPDLISITGNNYSNSFWYFFYNIEIHNGFGDGCYSSREPIQAFMSSQTIELGNDTTICNGNSLTIIPGSFEEYLWSGGSTEDTLEVDEAGTYSLTVTDQYSCTAIGEINIDLSDELIYNVVVFQPEITAPNNGEINIEIISATEPCDIVWSNTSTEFNLTNLSPGVYFYTITDSLGCEYSGDVEILNPSIIENSEDVVFKIYPNPANTTIEISTNSETNHIRIVNDNGQEILVIDNVEYNPIIDISELPNGIYYVVAKGKSLTNIRKLIICK